MKDNIKISIIIPCYNEEKTLNQIIEKVLKFKTYDKEIIIVDDCSSDNTQNIINELKNTKVEDKDSFLDLVVFIATGIIIILMMENINHLVRKF